MIIDQIVDNGVANFMALARKDVNYDPQLYLEIVAQ
jgi:hypothetical protein